MNSPNPLCKICALLLLLTAAALPSHLHGQNEVDITGRILWPRRHTIKIGVLEMINGNLPILFERRIRNGLSAQLGLGLTSKDGIWELSRVFDNLDTRTNTEALMGFSARLSLRYYFTGKTAAPRGPYFETMYRFRYYHGWVSTCNDPTAVSIQNPYLKETRNVSDLLFHVGHQVNTHSHFVMDFYVGGGLRYREGFTVRCIEADGIAPMPGRVHEVKYGPKFSFGFTLGFGL